jgi:hypothetical protein
MNKQLIFLGLLILFCATYVSAVVVSEPDSPTQTIDPKNLGELNIKISNIESKINNLATEERVMGLLQEHLVVTDRMLESYRSALTVSFVITGLCLIGLAYSIYFYFKSRGRL